MRSKYGNKKTVVDGITFDSKAEARRYIELKVLEAKGEIEKLELQPKYKLISKYTLEGRTVRETNYIGDFQYYCHKRKKLIVEDVKGAPETDVFKLKRKLFGAKYGFDITIIK